MTKADEPSSGSRDQLHCGKNLLVNENLFKCHTEVGSHELKTRGVLSGESGVPIFSNQIF